MYTNTFLNSKTKTNNWHLQYVSKKTQEKYRYNTYSQWKVTAPATISKSTSKVLNDTLKILQRYFEGTPWYYENIVWYLVKVFEGTSAVSRMYHSCTSKVNGNTILRRLKRGETVHWSSKQCKSSFYALPGHSATTGKIERTIVLERTTCCAQATCRICTWV